MEEIWNLALRWAVPAVCAGLAGWAAAQLKRAKAEDRAVRLGLQALLRDRLYWNYNHYQERGEYPIPARENVEEMFHWYKALGGNGTVANLVRELDGLPTKRGIGTERRVGNNAVGSVGADGSCGGGDRVPAG